MTGRIKTFVASLLFLAPAATPAYCAQPAPAYVSLSNSPHDFELFANGGWDGNWYVGYNSMWIVELSSPSLSQFNWPRVFIGAKLGRMKSTPVSGQPPWIRKSIPCEIFIGIASTPAWRASNSYFLTNCEDIPLDGNQEDAIQGVGESNWFWREVPLNAINFSGNNYLAVWSPTSELTGVNTSPIIAATAAKGKQNAWLNRAIKGSPPSRPDESLETKIHAFVPALAIKLIPPGSSQPVQVEMLNFQEEPAYLKWEIQVTANNFTRARPEVSLDGIKWLAFGRSAYNPPLTLMVSKYRIQREAEKMLPSRKKMSQAYIRITAWDEWENFGNTAPVSLFLKTKTAQ